jgi:nucleoside-triphosphatase THEP1
MAAGRKIPAAALCGLAGAYAFTCASFYPRARALLKRAGVWAGVLGVSLLAGLILGSPVSGLYMALRAFVLTIAFAAIGEELLNPSIRSALERLGGGVFFETLEYAFASLPGIIASFPSGRDIARRPVASLRKVISAAPLRLEPEAPAVFIITGAHGSGKSELVMELAQLLRAAGKKPGGVCAAGLWENGVRAGFDLIDLASGARVPLCRRGASGGTVTTGEFQFYKEGLETGIKALSPESLAGADAVFVDEIGFLELDGGGWADPLDALLEKNKNPLVLVVRDYLLDRVRVRWSLGRAIVWKTGEVPAEAAFLQLNSFIPEQAVNM